MRRVARRRPLNSQERAIVELLLAPDLPDTPVLRQQAEHAVVIGGCRCGCPTVDLHVPDHTPVAQHMTQATWPVQGQSTGVDGTPVDVILFLQRGRLSSLELVTYGDHPQHEWPPLPTITTLTLGRPPTGTPPE